MRHAAMSCAIACGVMVAGPGMAGTAVASADLFGIDFDVLDIFDHKKKKKKSDHGAVVSAQQNVGAKKSGGLAKTSPKTAVGAVAGGVSQSPGAASRSAPAQSGPESATLSGVPLAPSGVVAGGGGSGVVQNNPNIGRAPKLAPVPTAPSSRGVVIRAEPPAAAPALPATVAVAPVPVVLAPPVPVVLPPLPAADGLPSAPSVPAIALPKVQPPPADLPTERSMPESFRVGYVDYLRTASTAELLLAALPGIVGLMLVTAAGGVVGFRQARAAQTLPSPQIARFLP